MGSMDAGFNHAHGAGQSTWPDLELVEFDCVHNLNTRTLSAEVQLVMVVLSSHLFAIKPLKVYWR
jgi:hypothetical protein